MLGPTESGVFVEARSRALRYEIPVISMSVTADVDQNGNSWFFRTNVGISTRVNAIYEVLERRWIKSVAVLYEDTEFGQSAEREFRQLMEGRQADIRYLPLAFSNTRQQDEMVEQARSARVEAIGIFAERELIVPVVRRLEAIAYSPVLFTPLDVSLLRNELPDIYHVSLIDAADPRRSPKTGQWWSPEKPANEHR